MFRDQKNQDCKFYTIGFWCCCVICGGGDGGDGVGTGNDSVGHDD